MDPPYDPSTVSRVFDAYGDREWDRLVGTLHDRVSFELHRMSLEDHVRSRDRVLEVGAGAGRFTIELVRLGAEVTVGDVSEVQLELNRTHVGAADAEHGVTDRLLLDVTDLSRFADASFDAAVCFGGPVSYALERRGEAVEELFRVTAPGGPVLLSVMSLLGAFRAFFAAVRDDIERAGANAVDAVFETGDLPQALSTTAPNHLFRADEFRGLLEEHGAEVLLLSAANFLSVGVDDAWWTETPDRWQRLLAWERAACASPGAVDGGTHLIAVARRGSAARYAGSSA